MTRTIAWLTAWEEAYSRFLERALSKRRNIAVYRNGRPKE